MHKMTAASEGDDFSLTTSLRYDSLILSHPVASSSPIYLLPQHHQRLLDAARALQFHDAVKFLESTVPDGSTLQQIIEDSFSEIYGTQPPNTPLKVDPFPAFTYHTNIIPRSVCSSLPLAK
jgi:hypothetical protein